MNKSKYIDEKHDNYNNGPLVEKVENKVTQLLGKQRSLFFPKGVSAQLCALKVASELKENRCIVIHPRSHIAEDENKAYHKVMALKGLKCGDSTRVFTLDELKGIKGEFGTLIVELPLRRAGFKLPEWEDLMAMKLWCKEKNIHFHLDGARLWESAHHYQKSFAQIAQLFDTVYVSLYKGIGALSGAVLAGDKSFIKKCEVWRTRLGGDMYCAFPLLITALEGFDRFLPQIPQWVKRAHVIALLLNKIEGVSANKPHTNGFLVYVKGDLRKLNKALIHMRKSRNVFIGKEFMATENKSIQQLELQVGPGASEITNDEIVDYFKAIMAYFSL